jgi:hypothetical protein
MDNLGRTKWVKRQSLESGSELTGARTARLYMGWQGIGRLNVLEVRWTII